MAPLPTVSSHRQAALDAATLSMSWKPQELWTLPMSLPAPSDCHHRTHNTICHTERSEASGPWSEVYAASRREPGPLPGSFAIAQDDRILQRSVPIHLWPPSAARASRPCHGIMGRMGSQTRCFAFGVPCPCYCCEASTRVYLQTDRAVAVFVYGVGSTPYPLPGLPLFYGAYGQGVCRVAGDWAPKRDYRASGPV
jgi:hypothetical protein